MPADLARRPGLLDRLAEGAARVLGVRLDAAPQKSPTAGVMDCGPGGCGPGFGGGWGGSWAGPASVAITPSLDRVTIDDLMSDQLMARIVKLIVEDAMREGARPTLAGDSGELTPVVDWLVAEGGWAEAMRAMIYARTYGGGGVVCIYDDGRPADQEVDLMACREVVGYWALPKWFLVPDGVGSGRVRTGWYGPRIGRPEHYFVTPNVALGRDVPLPPEQREAVTSSAVPRDLQRILARSGNRFHRSRIVAWPYRDEMDLRLARWFPMWNGWGPGVVEAVLAPFLARRMGALKTTAIMNSVVVNTVTISDLEHRQSGPDMGAQLRQRLEFMKACRDFMSDSLPLIATDTKSKFESLSHNVSGIDKLIAAQRQYLLDVLEYPAVVLFGDSAGGMNGGGREGELRTYAARVKALQESWVWTAGTFGGGLRQMLLGAMAARRGPTQGRMDPTVKATWPSILTDTEDDRANRRLKNAQARAQDRVSLGLTSAAILRYDPTVREDYPGLDVDEGPLPVLTTATPGLAAPGGTTAAVQGDVPAEAATTPAAANEALTEDPAAPAQQTDAPSAAAPLTIPSDIHTEAEIATALKMSRPALRKMLTGAGVRPYVEAAPGQRGGARYSLGEALEAFGRGARQRADAARRMPDFTG